LIMPTKKKSGLGRGLGALIPQANSGVATINREEKPDKELVTPNKKVSLDVRTEKNISGVFEISPSDIVANTEQPRTSFTHQGMEDLSDSVRQHGILQPLAVTPMGGGKYELIAGERRLRAAKMIGLPAVPVFIKETEGSEKLVLALIENIQREDLNPIEEARAYRRLTDDFGLTQEDVAKEVGKARSTVANMMRLLELPEEILDAVATGAVSAGNARALLTVSDQKTRFRMFRKMLSGKMTVRDAEADAQKNSSRVRKSPEIMAIEEDLRDTYGTKVQVTSRAGKGKIVLQFYSEEEMKQLVSKLLVK
jgi:ParB family transcriptional regulator, chromosome partitioning protein